MDSLHFISNGEDPYPKSITQKKKDKGLDKKPSPKFQQLA